MILVDPPVDYGDLARERKLPGTWWSHMMQTDKDPLFAELHAMAKRLGLRREWFQGDHYDVTPSVRTRAIRCGAVEVPAKEIVRRAYLPSMAEFQARMDASDGGLPPIVTRQLKLF